MDDDIRARIVNEIVSVKWAMARVGVTYDKIGYWQGYVAALEWVLMTIDKDNVDDDPTSEEVE